MDGMSVRASVAMAVYEGEKFLIPQIESVLSQLGPEDELVISYDRSSDGTLDLIRDYESRDKRVTIVLDPSSGVIANFENALFHCRGKYLFIADQDDIWMDGKIDRMVAFLEETGAALVVHNGVTINEHDKIISRDFFSEYRIGLSFGRNFLKSRYSGCCMAFTANFRDIILPIPRYIDAYDRWFGLCAEAFCRIAFLDDVLIHHRVHGENYTPTSSRSPAVILKTRFFMLKALRKKAKELKRRK